MSGRRKNFAVWTISGCSCCRLNKFLAQVYGEPSLSGYSSIVNTSAVAIVNTSYVNRSFYIGRSFIDRSKPGDPASGLWNALADLNKDKRVDILDISIVAKEFGKSI